jgi:hypothetical protein
MTENYDYFYKIDPSNDDVTDGPYYLSNKDDENAYTEGLASNEYLLTDSDISTDPNYITYGLRDEFNTPRWKKVESETPEFKTDAELVANAKIVLVDRLHHNFHSAMEILDNDENKAKTEVLAWIQPVIQWIIDGQSGGTGGAPSTVVPTYWTDWKTARDVVSNSYDTKKAYIEDGSRTYAELVAYDISLP